MRTRTRIKKKKKAGMREEKLGGRRQEKYNRSIFSSKATNNSKLDLNRV
jgi:hypothetical protein